MNAASHVQPLRTEPLRAEPLRVQLNGRTPTADELAAPLLSGYGHFTAMQVRAHRTRGLDFHFARLDAATRELFGVGLSSDRVRSYLRQALGDETPNASVRINVFGPATPDVNVLVSVRPPQAMQNSPWSLRAVPYQRPFAHVKHVGGFAQGRYRELVAESGFDEALLVEDDGTIAEGAITNVGFVSGETVLWPDAPMLLGIGMQVLQRELAAAGIPSVHQQITLDDVPSFDGIFVTNSRGSAVVDRIDDHHVPTHAPFLAKVLGLLEAAPADRI